MVREKDEILAWKTRENQRTLYSKYIVTALFE